MDYRWQLFILTILCWSLSVSNAANENHDDNVSELKQQTNKKATQLPEKKLDNKFYRNLSLKASSNPVTAEQVPSTKPDDVIDLNDFTYGNLTEKNFTDILRQQEDNVIKVNHSYFEVQYYKNPKEAMRFWIDINSFNQSQFTHDVLSDSHRRAASISLPFTFSFYGNNLTKITVATGGFLYMGEYVHSWLAATQYIAPLMANFDTRNSSRAQIIYGYNSTVFVIQWDNVMLQEHPEYEFTFQCAIYSNGDIAFVYKNIPMDIDKIQNNNHPVKVGVSDAYFINRNQIFVRRKTIYEYHKIDVLKSDFVIQNQTAIYLKALPTCNSFKTCESCVTATVNFNCAWCESVQRCSDGYDRSRQEWISHHCEQKNFDQLSQCAAVNASAAVLPAPSNTNNNNSKKLPTDFTNSNNSANIVTPSPTVIHNNGSSSVINDHSVIQPFIHDHSNEKNLTNLEYNTQEQRMGSNTYKARSASAHSSLAISLFFVVSIILGISLWVIYAYRNPTSSSGQFLIRWRPSTWRWNGHETRYTAASIHM